MYIVIKRSFQKLLQRVFILGVAFIKGRLSASVEQIARSVDCSVDRNKYLDTYSPNASEGTSKRNPHAYYADKINTIYGVFDTD